MATVTVPVTLRSSLSPYFFGATLPVYHFDGVDVEPVRIAAADWTDDERRIAIAQNCFTEAPKKPTKAARD